MNDFHFGVVIGINRYPAISDLKFARSDAEDFYHWLIDPKLGAVPKENVILITIPDSEMPPGTSRHDAKPIKEQVEDAIFELWEKRNAAGARVHKNTRLYVFSSGHGIAPTPPEAALLMANAGAHHYGKNFPYDKFINYLRDAQPFKELVFFGDFCRERIQNAPLLGPTWTIVKKDNGGTHTVRGLATNFGDLAFEEEDTTGTNPDDLRGYFTKALLEGLNGQAADPKTHEINADNLSAYVTERVRVLTAHRRRPQTPFFALEPATPSIVFRRNVPIHEINASQTHTIHITFPTDFSDMVQIINGNLKKETEAHQASDIVWDVPLSNGFYQVTPLQGDNPFKNQGFFSVIGEDKNVRL